MKRAVANDIATCMYCTGVDPFSGQEFYVAKGLRDRKMQRALMQFFKPENYFEVRQALTDAGRTDLIGGGCDALIPSQPPKEALEARRERANTAVREIIATRSRIRRRVRQLASETCRIVATDQCGRRHVDRTRIPNEKAANRERWSQ